jgi:hypothetical protein
MDLANGPTFQKGSLFGVGSPLFWVSLLAKNGPQKNADRMPKVILKAFIL